MQKSCKFSFCLNFYLYQWFLQENEFATFHSFMCRFCEELTKIQKKKKKDTEKSTSGIYWAYKIGRFFIRGFRFCNTCWGHQFSGQAMHGIYFSFKVWKIFLLVRGRRELSKPRFGALRTYRTKRSDNCRKSVYFQKFLDSFKKLWDDLANIGRTKG